MPVHGLIGDTISAGLIPLYRRLEGEGPQAQRLLVLVATVYALSFSAVTTTLLVLFAEEVCRTIAPGASVAAITLSAGLLKIMALAMPFYVFSSILGFIETVFGSYGSLAWRPMILNIGSIVGVILAFQLQQDLWLATTMLASHIATLIWTVVQVRRHGRIWPENRPRIDAAWAMFIRFFRHILPLLGLPIIAQINVLIERVTSSWLGTAVIPGVDYARFVSDTMVQLVALPLGVLTMATMGGGSRDSMVGHITKVTRAILLLSFPIAVYVAGNARALVQLLFARGAFDQNSVAVTAPILIWMGAALGMTVTAYYLIKALNAQMRNKEALAFTAIAAAVNIGLNLGLWRLTGTMTIGIGAAGYSATLCLLSAHALGLFRPLLPIASRMLPILTLQLVLGWLVYHALGASGPWALVFNGFITISLWLSAASFDRHIREGARPFLSRMPFLRRLYD